MSPPTYFDPHGYFFTRLPETAYRRRLQPLNGSLTEELIPVRGPSADPGLLSGVLTCLLLCITPVHIGIGSYRSDTDAPGDVVADIIRDPQGNPVIPGSSLKGVFRAIAEAASKSCLLAAAPDKEDKEKLPEWLKSHVESQLLNADDQVPVEIRTPADLDHSLCNESNGFCPACAIFGTLGYRGRVAYTDAHIVRRFRPSDGFNPLSFVKIPARNTPQPHRLADKATWATGGLDIDSAGRKLVIPQPLGSKFYPNWDPQGHFQTNRFDWSQFRRGLPNKQPLNGEFYQQMKQQFGMGGRPPSLYNANQFQNGEPHDVIPMGALLEFHLHFQSILPWELGLLLFSMGMGIEEIWLPKIGGAKAFGLGSVLVQRQTLQLVSDNFTGSIPLPDQEAREKLGDFLTLFRNHQSYHAGGVADLRVGLSPNLAAQEHRQRIHIANNTEPMESPEA